jgi:N-methylhydantoinase A/oxoprolinase/acetone carboxylase beta subunit
MEQRARELLCRTGDPDDICFQWQADMRYLGQGFEVTVPLPNGPLDTAHIEQLRESFNATYRDLFDRIAHNERLRYSEEPQETLRSLQGFLDSPLREAHDRTDFRVARRAACLGTRSTTLRGVSGTYLSAFSKSIWKAG